jgi:hypothetical protein
MPPYYLIVPIVGTICGSAVLIVAMILISRHISQGRLSSNAAPSDDTVRRLERIEQIVETTAVEVERLAESNRFVAKLLAERSGALPR